MTRLSSLSVFFPALNEEKNVARMVEALSQILPSFAEEYEIIIVDDGSRDATGAIADGLARRDPHVRAVHHETNQGYGAAVSRGIEASRYDYIFYTDGDAQFDVSQLTLLVSHVATHDAVIGYRVNRRDAMVRRLNAWAWNRLINAMFRLHVKDVDCAFKLVRRSALNGIRLTSTGAMISTELLVKLTRAGRAIRQVGVLHLPRTAGKSTGGNPRVIARAFRELETLRRAMKEESSGPSTSGIPTRDERCSAAQQENP